MQHKSKKILSELSTFLRNNDNNDAIFSVSLVMDGLRFSARGLGYEKHHNCKLTALQTLQLLILSPFCSIGNASGYPGSALGKLLPATKLLDGQSALLPLVIDLAELFKYVYAIYASCTQLFSIIWNTFFMGLSIQKNHLVWHL